MKKCHYWQLILHRGYFFFLKRYQFKTEIENFLDAFLFRGRYCDGPILLVLTGGIRSLCGDHDRLSLSEGISVAEGRLGTNQR